MIWKSHFSQNNKMHRCQVRKFCVLWKLGTQEKRDQKSEKNACSLKKITTKKSVLGFLSKIIYTCPVMTQEKCSYLFCVNSWAEILNLSKLLELQSLACARQICQPFTSSILSPSIFLWRLTRNTAQIELSKERHSKSSHFKAMCGFCWVFCSASILLFSCCSNN